MKRKNGYYLLTSDIEELHQRYSKLYKQIQSDFENQDTTEQQLKRSCEVLLGAYNLEVEQLNDLRYAEYATRKARADAKDAEQIPWRKCWIRRLLFLPVTNRAQDIIEEEAALKADKLFTAEEKKLDDEASKLYGPDNKKPSDRKRKKILKKYLKYKRMLDNADKAEPSTVVAPMENAEQATEPPEPPARKPRKTKQQLGVEPL